MKSARAQAGRAPQARWGPRLPTFVFALLWCFAFAQVSLGQSADSVNAITLRLFQSQLRELPACSLLWERPVASGPAPPYMSKMQALGVKRAVLAVEAHWHGQIAEGLIVAGRVYFGKLDDGDSEILDKAARKRIEQSGLGAELDREAIIAVQLHASGPFRFDSREEPGYYEGQLVGVDVEFFAYPWIGRSEPLILEPMRSPRALEGAAARADVAALQGAFATGPHDQNELNRAMIAAALAPFDNRAVFIALLNAGAQLEPARPFVSPLFNALGTPCNVEDLLALGADPNVPDERGRTPLAAAREGGYAASAKLLQLAGGHL